jgi:hypothetical protein
MTNKLGLPMFIYAFPNGSYREEQIDIARDSGVRHILLVDENFAGRSSVHKRFTFDAKTQAEAQFKALGGLRSVKWNSTVSATPSFGVMPIAETSSRRSARRLRST